MIVRGFFIVTCTFMVFLTGCHSIHKADKDRAKELEDQDKIILKQQEVIRLERLDLFMRNVAQNKKDRVRIISYTLEGAPIYKTLNAGKKQIQLTIDHTEDPYAGEKSKAEYSCKELKKILSETYKQLHFDEKTVVYYLTGCGKNNEQILLLTVPYDLIKDRDKSSTFAVLPAQAA